MKNGSTKITWARWESLDWEKQDVELAAELRVTRERVRQVRKKLEKPPSPLHYRNRHSPVHRIERCLKRLASDKEIPPQHCLVARFNTSFGILHRAGKNIGIEFGTSHRLITMLPINWDLPNPDLVRIWLKGIRCHKHAIAQHRYEHEMQRPLWRLWKRRVARGDKKAYRIALKQEVAKRRRVRISQRGPGKEYCVSPHVA